MFHLCGMVRLVSFDTHEPVMQFCEGPVEPVGLFRFQITAPREQWGPFTIYTKLTGLDEALPGLCSRDVSADAIGHPAGNIPGGVSKSEYLFEEDMTVPGIIHRVAVFTAPLPLRGAIHAWHFSLLVPASGASFHNGAPCRDISSGSPEPPTGGNLGRCRALAWVVFLCFPRGGGMLGVVSAPSS